MPRASKIKTFLWFDGQAEEAARFYTSIFEDGGGPEEDIDYHRERLSAGGKPVQCGWLKDRYAVSWQVVPRMLPELFTGDAKPPSAQN